MSRGAHPSSSGQVARDVGRKRQDRVVAMQRGSAMGKLSAVVMVVLAIPALAAAQHRGGAAGPAMAASFHGGAAISHVAAAPPRSSMRLQSGTRIGSPILRTENGVRIIRRN